MEFITDRREFGKLIGGKCAGRNPYLIDPDEHYRELQFCSARRFIRGMSYAVTDEDIEFLLVIVWVMASRHIVCLEKGELTGEPPMVLFVDAPQYLERDSRLADLYLKVKTQAKELRETHKAPNLLQIYECDTRPKSEYRKEP